MAATDPQAPEAPQRNWIAELDASEKWMRAYWDRCRRLLRRYRNDNATADGQPDTRARRYAIFWSNTEVLKPAVYARQPTAVVSRRYKDSDKVGRYASEVLERALNFTIDQYDFNAIIKLCRDDYLIQGRGQVWVRYEPHVGNPPEGLQVTNDAEDGDEPEETGYAETCCDHLNNSDWGFNPSREWDEVYMVWRKAFMTKPELIKRFGKAKAQKIQLDMKSKDDPVEEASARTSAKKAAIYEIWDKGTATVYWVSKSYAENGGIIEQKPDWLKLEDFFPCPRPLMATTIDEQYIPIPDYVYYQDQAEEIDDLTARIGNLTDALRMVGIYAGEENVKLQQMFTGTQNELIAVTNYQALADKGGLKGVIEWMPLDIVVETLKGCIETRKQLLDDVYQITGISDIQRGDTDPDETATAQGIKATWGSARTREKQKEVSRFCRDILRIKGEIIAKQYKPDLLAAMTDVQLPTTQQLQALQMAKQQNIPIPPQMVGMETRPTWDDVNALLKNDATRTFRVDVETDSTIEPNDAEQQAQKIRFVTVLTEFIGQAMPVMQQVPALAQLGGETIKFLARSFHVGREMEDVIESTFDQIGQMPAQQQGPGGMNQQEAQLKQAELQQTAQQHQQQMQLEQAKLQQTAQQSQQDNAVKVHLAQTDAQLGQQKIQAENMKTQVQAQIGAADMQNQQRQQELDHVHATQQHQATQNQQQIDQQANQNAHVVAMRPQPKASGGR